MAARGNDLGFNSLGCIVLPVALFAGLMVSTAGMAIYPPITFVANPAICSGTIDYVSTSYSYRPGQQGVERTIYCVAGGAKGAREDVTMKAIGVSFLVYSALFFLLIGFVLRPLLRRRYERTMAAVRIAAPAGVQDILARVSETMQRSEADAVVRDAAVGAPRGGGDLAERLAQLKQLREQGLITAEDYEAKKAELLSRL
ncbi:MAG TPA: SHOCT domain-containing protein [Allosphingosinicella sp.]|nr:SHOCT domain-containing protein [Allosphingosinicella sp.]